MKYFRMILTVAATLTAVLFLNACGESVEGRFNQPQPVADAYVAPTTDNGGPASCHYDTDCPNGQTCQYGWCLPAPTSTDVVATPDHGTPGSCTTKAQCLNGEWCYNGYCVPETSKPAGYCDAQNPCAKQKGKTSTCVESTCVDVPITCPEGFVLNQLDDCVKRPTDCDESTKPSQNLCTKSITCNPETGKWAVEAIVCDDNDPNTKDTCDPTKGCIYTFDCGGTCDDGDPCTTDSCDAVAKDCVHTQLCKASEVCVLGGIGQNAYCEFRCKTDPQCDDGNLCTDDSCDLSHGICVHDPKVCNDNDPYTVDSCNPQTGKCQFTDTPCKYLNDDNPCTVDECVDGVPVHSWTDRCDQGTMCFPATGKCTWVGCKADTDCDDSNGCTADLCVNGQCVFPPKACADGEKCDGKTGECFLPAPCDGGCPDSGDLCAPNECVNGACTPVPAPCDGKTNECNPVTGLCTTIVVKPDCVDGTTECQQIKELDGVTLQFYMVCAAGRLWQVASCGPVDGGKICAVGDGCLSK